MTLPWEQPVSSAETMQPDLPTPAVAPPPIPAVATNRVTGQMVSVDLAPQLQAAIQQAIDTAVAAHPILGKTVVAAVKDRERGDRTIMHGSLFDALVAVMALLFTIVSPGSPITGVLWIAAAVLASRTLIQGAIYWAKPEVVP